MGTQGGNKLCQGNREEGLMNLPFLGPFLIFRNCLGQAGAEGGIAMMIIERQIQRWEWNSTELPATKLQSSQGS
jgi:hypothetical protein